MPAKPGLVGVTVSYSGGTPATSGSVTTGAGGAYSITGLQAGTYSVTYTPPSGFVNTGTAPLTVILTAGEADTGNDFFTQTRGSISGFKWNDLDGDSVVDGGEPKLTGWTIQLATVSDFSAIAASTVTDGSGNYTFANLPPGTYYVREVGQAGWAQTGGSAVYTVVLSAITPTTSTGSDFGNQTRGSISGFKWNDLDGDGDVDATEPRLNGWTIELSTSPTFATIAATTFTSGTSGGDPTGAYAFANLAPGTYYVREVLQAGWTQTSTPVVHTVVLSATTPTTSTGSDFGNLLVDASIDVTKYVSVDGGDTWDDANTPTGPYLLSGYDAPQFRFVLTNSGNVPLSGVTFSDPDFDLEECDPEVPATLAVGASFECVVTGIWAAGQHTNVASASATFTGSDGATYPDDDSDAANYFGANPQLAISKVTFDGATSGDSLSILVGESITWQYTVTNTGNVPLSVVVTDSEAGVSPVLQSGDANANNKLDLAETWIYTASGTATAGFYSNTGEAKGTFTDSAGHSRTDTETDTSGYFGANPQLAISKVTFDGATSGDSLSILVGESITWQYTVTNTGNVPLSVVVTDSEAGVSPVLQSGDANANNKLDLAETWIYTASGTATAGFYSNTGEAKGTFTDSAGHSRTDTETDTSGYFGANPQLAISKVTFDGATSGDSLSILVGESITWQYTVTNTGNVPLSVVVTDSEAGVSPVLQSGDANANNKLDLAETWIYTASGTATAGFYSNTGEAKGTFTDSAGHSRTDTETDTSGYFGANPQLAISKVTFDGATSGDSLSILVGESITWQYTVTNTGNVPLSVVVTDSEAGVSPVLQSGDANANNKLDLAETWIYTASGTATAGFYSNTGEAKGTFTDSAGHSRTDTETDTSGYFGANPQLALTKTASPTSYNTVGQFITYTFTIQNTGNVTLNGPFSVTDDRLGTFICASGPLAPAATTSCTKSYAITQADINAGSVVNNAVASTNYADTAGHSVAVVSNNATATIKVVLGSTSALTHSASKSTTEVSNQLVTDFEILVDGKSNTVVATNPGQFFYHQWATNPYTITTTWKFQLNFGPDFITQTQDGNPIKAFVQLPGSSALTQWTDVSAVCWRVSNGCPNDNTARITVNNVPAGATVWVQGHIDFKWKGSNVSALGTPSPLSIPRAYSLGSHIDIYNQSNVKIGESNSTTSVLGRGKKVTIVYGYMKDTNGAALVDAWVKLGQGSNSATAKTNSEGFYVFFDGQLCAGDGIQDCTGSWATAGKVQFGSNNVSTTVSFLGVGGLTPAAVPTFPPGATKAEVKTASQTAPLTTITTPTYTWSVKNGDAFNRNFNFKP